MKELKREAKRAGIAWADVEATYRMLRQEKDDAREHEAEIRRQAWARVATEGSQAFWRHGFAKRFDRAFGAGDRTLIPRFDEIADGLAYTFPELAEGGDPAEKLYELLAAPFSPRRPNEEVYREALDVILAARREPPLEALFLDALADF